MQYPLCLSLLGNKSVDVLPMITHRLGFSEEEVEKGFDIALRSVETKAIKVRNAWPYHTLLCCQS